MATSIHTEHPHSVLTCPSVWLLNPDQIPSPHTHIPLDLSDWLNGIGHRARQVYRGPSRSYSSSGKYQKARSSITREPMIVSLNYAARVSDSFRGHALQQCKRCLATQLVAPAKHNLPLLPSSRPMPKINYLHVQVKLTRSLNCARSLSASSC